MKNKYTQLLGIFGVALVLAFVLFSSKATNAESAKKMKAHTASHPKK